MKRTAAVAGAALVALGGCADRGLSAGPSSAPGTATWAAVTVAAVAAAVVLAAIISLPARRPGGSALGSWVLALQAGGVAVGATVLAAAAIRSEQLLDRPEDAEQAASLLRLSGLDGGNTSFFNLVVAVTVVLAGLFVAATTLAARCAGDTDPVERTLATGLLGLEVLGSLACWVLLALGFRHLGFVLPAVALPLLAAAAVATWPRGGVPATESLAAAVERPHA